MATSSTVDPNLGDFVFRAMQGVCAALVTPTALAVIIHVFDEDERAGAIGTWTALSSVVGVFGPFIGGV